MGGSFCSAKGGDAAPDAPPGHGAWPADVVGPELTNAPGDAGPAGGDGGCGELLSYIDADEESSGELGELAGYEPASLFICRVRVFLLEGINNRKFCLEVGPSARSYDPK